MTKYNIYIGGKTKNDYIGTVECCESFTDAICYAHDEAEREEQEEEGPEIHLEYYVTLTSLDLQIERIIFI